MSLFKKKKRTGKRDTRWMKKHYVSEEQASDSVKVPVYGPHDTYSAQDYCLTESLALFEQNFEERCKAWMAEAHPDQYNRGYMDLMIDQLEREAQVALDRQEVSHRSVICELEKIWKGDEIKAKKKLAGTTNERKTVEKELAMLEDIYYRGTAFAATHPSAYSEKEAYDYE